MLVKRGVYKLSYVTSVDKAIGNMLKITKCFDTFYKALCECLNSGSILKSEGKLQSIFHIVIYYIIISPIIRL